MKFTDFSPSVSKEGHIVARLTADVVLYLDKPLSEMADLTMAFHDVVVAAYGQPELKWYLTNTMTGFEPSKANTFRWLGHWLGSAKARKDRMAFTLKGGESCFDAAPFGLEVRSVERSSGDFGDRSSMLRASFGVGRLDTDPSAFASWVASLAGTEALVSGHAGLSFERSAYYEEQAYSQAYAWGMRFRAADISDGRNATLAVLRGRVKGVGWLTLLGKDLSAALGGTAALAKKLGGGHLVTELAEGATLVQCGERPILGDMNAQQELVAYRKLDGLLAPMREKAIADYPPFTMGTDDNNSRTEAWLRRFNE